MCRVPIYRKSSCARPVQKHRRTARVTCCQKKVVKFESCRRKVNLLPEISVLRPLSYVHSRSEDKHQQETTRNMRGRDTTVVTPAPASPSETPDSLLHAFRADKPCITRPNNQRHFHLRRQCRSIRPGQSRGCPPPGRRDADPGHLSQHGIAHPGRAFRIE